MNIKQIKLKFRDTINQISGKQTLIDEYNALTSQLCSISDITPVGTPEKEYLRERLDIITESSVVYTGSGSYVKSYNPWKGSKATTRRKIVQLHETFYFLQKTR